MVLTAHRPIRNAWLKISASEAGLDLSQLILHQILWIDHVVDPPSLYSLALEVLSVLSIMSSLSRRAQSSLLDLIAALPNFLAGDDPSRVDDVVAELRDRSSPARKFGRAEMRFRRDDRDRRDKNDMLVRIDMTSRAEEEKEGGSTP